MKVAVYSGSFNPFHIGHLAVVKYLLDAGGFDKVYLVVSPRNPFKAEAMSDTALLRLEAVRKAVERNALSSCVRVDDIEFNMPLPSYTINTLDALRGREPENVFTLVVGGDNLHELPDWRQGWRILSEYGVAVYPREGFDLEADLEQLRRRCAAEASRDGNAAAHSDVHYATPVCSPQNLKVRILAGAPLVTVSSTLIREKLARGEDISALLA